MSQPTLVLVRDLLFASKITATAKSLGATIKIIRDPKQLANETGERLIVDLNQPGAMEAAAEWRAASGGAVVGFVSHVDADTIRLAQSSGIDQILPRSRFVERLAELLK